MKNILLFLPIFLLVFLWSIYGPVLRFFEGLSLGPIELNFLSFSSSAIVLFVLFWFLKTDLSFPSKSESKKILFYAISLASTNFFLFYAFTQTTLANTILLHYTGLLWSSLAAIIFFKEKLSKWKIISAMLTILGVIIIFVPELSFESKYFLGNFFALVSSFGYGGIVLASKSLKSIEPKRAAFYCVLFCALVFVLPFLFFGKISNFEQIGFGFLFGATYGSIETILLVFGMMGISIITAGLILVLEIPVTALIGLFFYGENILANTFFGGILIIIGVALLIAKEKTTKT